MQFRPVEDEVQSAAWQHTFTNLQCCYIDDRLEFAVLHMKMRRCVVIEKHPDENRAKHGVDFAVVEQFDWESAIVADDQRRDYGEQRRIAIGRNELRLLAWSRIVALHSRDRTAQGQSQRDQTL